MTAKRNWSRENRKKVLSRNGYNIRQGKREWNVISTKAKLRPKRTPLSPQTVIERLKARKHDPSTS